MPYFYLTTPRYLTTVSVYKYIHLQQGCNVRLA